LPVISLLVTYVTPAPAQRELSGAAEAKLALDRLNVTGSVLMIAAHPDDENTAVLAYFARGRKVRTGYLSLTRGEGGQNLIGPEQGDALGVVRTQELLAARRIDGAEQFFSRAIDFGFSKTSQETFEKWGGHDKILSDVVWVIRRFRPDVIVLRFSGTPRDGHGQHQVSAILGKEAFSAAADPKRFPEQLKWVEPWQAKRIMWNTFAFTRQQELESEKLPNKIVVDPGDYDPVLGHSYAEIAGMSRSLHRSQGQGTPERRGAAKNYLVTVEGEAAKQDTFDGIDITWNRVPGGGPVGEVLQEAERAFDPAHPTKIVPLLFKAQKLMAELHHPVVELKRRELSDAIALCSGLWLDVTADKYAVTPGGALKLSATVINRDRLPVEVQSMEVEGMSRASLKEAAILSYNEPKVFALSVDVPESQPLSQPYWLREPKQGEMYTVTNQLEIGLPENPPVLQAHFHLRIESDDVEVIRPVHYRYIERSQGEVTRAIVIEPPVALQLSEGALLFPNQSAKSVRVQVKANVPGASGKIEFEAPAGWGVTPASQDFQLANTAQEVPLSFQLTPPAKDAQGTLKVSAKVGQRTVAVGMDVISYPHIPPQILFPRANADLVRTDVRLLAKNIGYVMGAGDDVPDALRGIGANVEMLSADDLKSGDLSRFDAVVTGVCAYSARPDLLANQQRLLEYVKAGGTLVVQYQGLRPSSPCGGDPELLAQRIGPYPIKLGRDRVTEENAQIELQNPECTLLHEPNQITSRDFEGWVQERGLYFASEWDPHYQPLFSTHDTNEKPLLGGTLYTRYGKGVYVFTAFSWFRELPAGVPGAFRIFANFLSAGKAQ
jgi:LmbE family N-acetylglucosaminyl deacetylase